MGRGRHGQPAPSTSSCTRARTPCDFIELGLERNLSANCRAQADALAFGTDDASLPPWRQYPGNRPSSMLVLEKPDARTLGRIIALYEHKVFKGVIWNINSFDQWGVELGKELAKKILMQQTKERSWTRKPSTSASASSSRWWG